MEKLLQAQKQRQHAVLYMDLDDFKNINDSLGHYAGDCFLKHLAGILKQLASDRVFVARLGGDEFAVILMGLERQAEILPWIRELIQRVRTPWVYDGEEFYESISIGISVYPNDGDTFSLLLRNADIAMYHTKEESKDGFTFYEKQFLEASNHKSQMVNDLHHALENNEFKLYYQPILDLADSSLIGVEALIRWNHPKKGMISPVEFIPVAEESGLINKIGDWVMTTAVRQKSQWEKEGFPHLKVSINVSGYSLNQKGFSAKLKKLILETGVCSKEIQLEITETALIRRMKSSVEVLKEIRALKVKIALDDFGTGYSSLTYLKNLPIDIVKLDASFVRDILKDQQNNVIVESIIKMTHELRLKIVAEGIETKEQLYLLNQNDCDYGQGYLFSRPLPQICFERIMGQKNRIPS